MSRPWSDVIVARNDLIRKLESAGRRGDLVNERSNLAAELRRHAFLSALIITGQNGFGRDVSLRPGARIASAPPVFSRLTPLAYPPLLQVPSSLCRELREEEILWDAVKDHPSLQFGRTRLMYAAKTGDVARLRWLLARGARPDLTDSDGRTALYWAARFGHAEAARVLLTQGAAVDAPTAYGARPLYIASFEGHAAVVRELLARGAAVDAEFDGGTPLLFAARGGHLEVLRELLQHGAAVDAAGTGETALCAASRMVACARAHPTNRILVTKAVRLSLPRTEEEWQRWHQRCAGHREVVRELLARGAAVEFADEEEGFRPLHHACKAGCVELVKVLLEGGAAVNALSGDAASTPLCVASENGHEAVVNALLAAGAAAETTVLLRTRAQARARAY